MHTIYVKMFRSNIQDNLKEISSHFLQGLLLTVGFLMEYVVMAGVGGVEALALCNAKAPDIPPSIQIYSTCFWMFHLACTSKKGFAYPPHLIEEGDIW